jgi:hypothetical protein
MLLDSFYEPLHIYYYRILDDTKIQKWYVILHDTLPPGGNHDPEG